MDPRPNLIFIVADGLGYADLGCYGGRPAAFGAVSPMLDGMAANGLRFTQGYANSPVCSPTRCGQRALRDGDWKYLRVDGHDYLFDLSADERERANRAALEPDRLQRLRADWEAWDASLPPIPEDATVSLGYSARDMPQR